MTLLMEDENPLIHYVLMRQDVPDYLSGKAQAQSNHAGTAMVIRGSRSGNAKLFEEIGEWAEQGDGFGIVIVKTVTAREMRQAVELALAVGLHAGYVNDTSYPIWDGEKVQTIPLETCAFVFGRKLACWPVVGPYPLLREKGER